MIQSRNRCSRVILLLGVAGAAQSILGEPMSGGAARIKAQQVCSPKIDHFELTQATQVGRATTPASPYIEPAVTGPSGAPPVLSPLAPQSSNSDVDLLLDRATGLRIYVKDGEGCPDANGDGRPDVGAHFVVRPSNAPSQLFAFADIFRGPSDASAPWNRDQESSTLNANFVFNSGTGDTMNIHLCVGIITYQFDQLGNVIGATLSQSTHCTTQNIQHLQRTMPDIMFIPLGLTLADNQTFDPPVEDVVPGLADGVLAMWPLPSDTGLAQGGAFVGSAVSLDLSEFESLAEPFAQGFLLLDLQRMHCSFGAEMPEILYAFIDTEVDTGTDIGFTQNKPEVVVRVTDWTWHTVAHEFGHIGGFDEGGANVLETGWDVFSALGFYSDVYVRPTGLEDLMESGFSSAARWWARPFGAPESGGGYQVMLEETPQSVYNPDANCLIAENSPADEQWFVSAIQTTDQGAAFENIQVLYAGEGRFETDPVYGGNTTLRILDQGGALLHSTTLNLSESGVDSMVVPVPALPEMASLEIERWDTESVTVSRTVIAPEIQINHPTSSSNLTTTMELEWAVQDADSDFVRSYAYFVDATSDRWYPIAGTSTMTSTMTVSTSQWPATASGSLLIVATDGLNTSFEVVHAIAITQNRPPVVTILSPQEATSVTVGENVVLVANAFDPEDGWIDPGEIEWISSISGLIGTGTLNTSQLALGTHQLVARVQGHGGPAEDSVVLRVLSIR